MTSNSDGQAPVRGGLRTVGATSRAVFGLPAEEYLRRHLDRLCAGDTDIVVVAAADVIVTEPTLGWLLANRGTVLTDGAGRPLIGTAPAADADALVQAVETGSLPPPFVGIESGSQEVFVRKLRRRERLRAIDLRTADMVRVERLLFDLVYKGVTDIVTRFVWPTPAFHVVRVLARWGVSPNMVTVTGMIFMVVAAILFAEASWGPALLAAWTMTFLDTVDGKLARVTVTSSKLGNLLDHGTDIVHPPAWWFCVALGISAQAGDPSLVWTSCVVILATYVAGRASETSFKKTFGFNQYLWRPFDSRLRMVIARRNVNLVFLTVGAVAGAMDVAFVALAGWSLISIAAQLFRFGHARLESSNQPIVNWMAR